MPMKDLVAALELMVVMVVSVVVIVSVGMLVTRFSHQNLSIIMFLELVDLMIQLFIFELYAKNLCN